MIKLVRFPPPAIESSSAIQPCVLQARAFRWSMRCSLRHERAGHNWDDRYKGILCRMYNFSNREKLFLGLSFILFVLFFIPAMHRSLWIDETITYWVVKDGFRDLFYRAIHFQGQSPFYYLIVWCFIQVERFGAPVKTGGK